MKRARYPLVEIQRQELETYPHAYMTLLVKVRCKCCGEALAKVFDTAIEIDGEWSASPMLGPLVEGVKRNHVIVKMEEIRESPDPWLDAHVDETALWLAQLDRSTTPRALPMWCRKCRDDRPSLGAHELRGAATNARNSEHMVTLRV